MKYNFVKINLLSFLLTATLFAECTIDEIIKMKNSNFNDKQIQRICANNSMDKKNDASDTSDYKESSHDDDNGYYSIEAGYVSQSGPGFYKYTGYYGNEVTQGMSVGGAGASFGIGYTFYDATDNSGNTYFKHKRLNYSFEDDYGSTIEDIDISESVIGFNGIKKNGPIHFLYGAFIGLGSSTVGTEDINFFTYGPEVGFLIDITEMFQLYSRFTWQERSYSESSSGLTFDNFPFGAEFGIKINFKRDKK